MRLFSWARASEEDEGVGIQNKAEGFTTNRMEDDSIKMKGKNRIDFLTSNTGHAEQGHGLGYSFNLSCLCEGINLNRIRKPTDSS